MTSSKFIVNGKGHRSVPQSIRCFSCQTAHLQGATDFLEG